MNISIEVASAFYYPSDEGYYEHNSSPVGGMHDSSFEVISPWTARVTDLHLELIYKPEVPIRVTDIYEEVLLNKPIPIRVTMLYLEVLYYPNSPWLVFEA